MNGHGGWCDGRVSKPRAAGRLGGGVKGHLQACLRSYPDVFFIRGDIAGMAMLAVTLASRPQGRP